MDTENQRALAAMTRGDMARYVVGRVASLSGVAERDLLGSKRSRELMMPRFAAMALARSLCGMKLAEIGELFGGRTHAAVIHGQRQCRDWREVYPDYARFYANLERGIFLE